MNIQTLPHKMKCLDFAFGGSAFRVAVLLLWSLVVNFHFFTSQLAWVVLSLIFFFLQETEDPLSWGISST